jgi:hypothetical protein
MTDGKNKAFQPHPAHRNKADEEKFLDRKRSCLFVTEEHVIIDS